MPKRSSFPSLLFYIPAADANPAVQTFIFLSCKFLLRASIYYAHNPSLNGILCLFVKFWYFLSVLSAFLIIIYLFSELIKLKLIFVSFKNSNYLLTLLLFLLIIISTFNLIFIYKTLLKPEKNNAKKNVSTAQQESKEKTRISKPYVHVYRQECYQKKTQKRPQGTDEILSILDFGI